MSPCPLGEGHAQAVEAAAARIAMFSNQWRDPENGPFDGDENDYLWALAQRMLAAYHDSLRAQGVVLVEAATKPCETCEGMGYTRVGSRTSDWGADVPCPACGGSGTVPVVLVDRDAEIEKLRGLVKDAKFREVGLHEALRRETEKVERLRVDRDALIGEIAEALRDAWGAREHEPRRPGREAADFVLRRFAPGKEA